jgi:EAL domain-containing protein (putative c-di-GMP-specific phosphodiesterase class I)/ActR/RegA family two-component response regulator
MHLVALDDDESIAQFMATVARDRGWTAQTVTHEADFQALISAAPPDAIMLDLQLGASDGVEQLHFLHSEGYGGAIVLISGFDSRVLASAQQIGDSLGLSVAAVLEKPARAARIHEVLAAIEQKPAAPIPPAPVAQPEHASISADDVAQAISAGRMELYLQPIVSAKGHVVTCAEALIRWHHPVLGLVQPDRFIPIAEENAQTIDRLTMWVTEAAVAHYRQLAALGSATRICINISGRNLCSGDFPDRMAGVLERCSLPPGAIGLEITESVAMHDLETTAAVLTRLRLKSFPIAIDDFGMGHSTLAALRRMPFTTIKIDKSFVDDLATSSDSLTIVRSVIQLARDMGLASVAEGVETADTARLLIELGIDSLQGFHFSRPLPFDAFAAWLRAWSHDHAAGRA